MLRVTIDVVPLGDETQTRRLRTLKIVNENHEGPDDWYHYSVVELDHEGQKRGGARCIGRRMFVHRRSDGVEVCVRKALEALGRP